MKPAGASPDAGSTVTPGNQSLIAGLHTAAITAAALLLLSAIATISLRTPRTS